MGTAQVYRDNGDRQPFKRLNINLGSISSSTGNNFLNGWVAFTFGVTMCKKTTIKNKLKICKKSLDIVKLT
jgi:hypothetical protein